MIESHFDSEEEKISIQELNLDLESQKRDFSDKFNRFYLELVEVIRRDRILKINLKFLSKALKLKRELTVSSLLKSLKIDRDKKELLIEGSHEGYSMNQIVNAIEYGSLSMPPLPLIRNTIDKIFNEI